MRIIFSSRYPITLVSLTLFFLDFLMVKSYPKTQIFYQNNRNLYQFFGFVSDIQQKPGPILIGNSDKQL